MFKTWSFLRTASDRRDPPWQGSEGGEDTKAKRLAAAAPLDIIGQNSESVRDRVNGLAERLHDLRSLSTDFGAIIGPLNEFLEQHAASRAKLLETEALLQRERDVCSAVRGELNSVQLSYAGVASELQETTALLRDREALVQSQESQLTEARLTADDLKIHRDSLDDRLFAETERLKALAGEVAMLRSEVSVLDDERTRAEQQASEANEIIALSEAEMARLQHLAETMAQKVASLSRALSELEPQLQVARGTVSDLQGRLSTEQANRARAEASREAERSDRETEVTGLSMKIDGLNAHIVNADKLLAHVRDQLRDRTDALRSAEKGQKDATVEKAALERRLETALESQSRSAAQYQAAHKTSAELRDRCDMLVKAVAAKDQLLDISNRKAAGLLDRIEQISARFQHERTEAEATHRRLIEELQNERSERSLAHGALDIARKSRSTLLARYTALKREIGPSGHHLAEKGDELDADTTKVASDNVMPFLSSDESR